MVGMELPFVKLHGNGNDFILIDEFKEVMIPDEMKARFSSLYCDRKFGIGGDGVLFLSKEGEKIRMRIFQPDESEAEMCGNGIRCLAKYAYDSKYIGEKATINTLAGPVEIKAEYDKDGDFYAEVEMTDPIFDSPSIQAGGKGEFHEIISGYEVYAVNTGVPHAVVFIRDLDMIDIAGIAPGIRFSHYFPVGANVNFVQVLGEDTIKIRTYERGVEDETLSCGTGATASAVMAHHLKKTGPVVTVETPGGPLVISVKEKVYMKGPAVTVFIGSLPL
jgi:diaminopimelate epimerase